MVITLIKGNVLLSWRSNGKSISRLNLRKFHPRSTMSEERLNGLVISSIEKRIIIKLITLHIKDLEAQVSNKNG